MLYIYPLLHKCMVLFAESLQKNVVISPLKTMHQLSYYHVKLSCNPRVNLYHGFY